jgi:GST-like protein
MITLYTWTTPNGRKISIGLEELGLTYEVKPIDINKSEQFDPDFVKISPNGKIPAIVDHAAEGGPLHLFESGAILVYLAEKARQLLAPEGPELYTALQWIFWQTSGLGPTLGQLAFFVRNTKEKSPEAIERFTAETHRLFAVMDKRLNERAFLAGARYSIADIASYPWTLGASNMLKLAAPAAWGDFPAIERWLHEVGSRPAVKRGMAIPKV